MEPGKGPKIAPTPSFVRPFLYALNRMQANEILRPAQYLDRATMLLVDRLGVVGAMPEGAFTHGVVGIMADHTHYFDGFAFMLRLRQGVAAAVRPNNLGNHRIVLEGYTDLTIDDKSPQADAELSSLFKHILRALDLGNDHHYDVSIVGCVPTGLGAAFQAAVTISLIRSLLAVHQIKATDQEVRSHALKALNAWYGHRFSPAFVIGSLATQTDGFILADTSTMSHLPVEIPAGAKLGWGVIEWSKDWVHAFQGAGKRNEQALKALNDVQSNGFAHLTSLRNLEHRELEQAVEAVPRRSRGTLRFLVTENRNVQKLVLATKKVDWQFFGALMMISEASKATDWSTTDSVHELITREAEKAALDGIFGVVQSGEGGCMLVLGQPFSLPAFLDHIKKVVSEHTREQVETFII